MRTVYFNHEVTLNEDSDPIEVEVTVALDGSYTDGWDIENIWINTGFTKTEEEAILTKLYEQSDNILAKAVDEIWS
jgi:hypothetical protein